MIISVESIGTSVAVVLGIELEGYWEESENVEWCFGELNRGIWGCVQEGGGREGYPFHGSLRLQFQRVHSLQPTRGTLGQRY